MESTPTRSVISLLLENEPGALARVANLFSARNYNIEALNVAPTNDPTLSHMTITIRGDRAILEQILLQLEKLVDVFTLCDTETVDCERRELLFVLLAKTDEQLARQAIENFCGQADIITPPKADTIVLQLIGQEEHIMRCVGALPKQAIRLLVRSGSVSIPHHGYPANVPS